MWPRWLRALATLWVAFDSKKRKSINWFWVLVLFLLGPLLLPVYMTFRPLLPEENRNPGIIWNLIINYEKLLVSVAGIAAAAVFVENLSLPHDKDLAEVRRAEIKAGTILGALFVFGLFLLEKIVFSRFTRGINSK
ncbi:MAG: hypothetical protein ACQETH_05090 [Candidatus Rifleibacteriota bacterium]